MNVALDFGLWSRDERSAELDGTEPIDLRLFLSTDGQVLTETWLYQYVPPPPDRRTL